MGGGGGGGVLSFVPLCLGGRLALCMKVVVSSLKILEVVVAEWGCCQHVSASPFQHMFLCMFVLTC